MHNRFLEAFHQSFWQNQRRWFCWWPVGMGLGIFIYFIWPTDPPYWWLLFPIFGCLLGGGFRLFTKIHTLGWILFFAGLSVLVGLSAAFWRTHTTQTTFLHHDYGPLALRGQIHAVDFTPRGPKYTIEINKYYPWRASPPPSEKLPDSISLLVPQKQAPVFNVGENIYVGAVNLLPWQEPLSCHDTRRLMNYFKGIGARGVTLKAPVKAYTQTDEIGFLWLEQLRHRLTCYLYQALPGQTGAIAAALITGKKTALAPETYESFSNAGLSHVLAISGLHLSLVATIFYFLSFGLLRCIPYLILRYSVHRIALVCALLGAAGYALLSGWAIPVQRAFTMLLIVMTGLYFYRQAFSMRSVALAATLILLITPENLMSLSFQLSFASVIGLIAFFEAWQRQFHAFLSNSLLRYVVMLVASSLIAGLITLPFTIFYFHKFSVQSISANLLAIPLTGFAILPLAILSGIAGLVGAEDLITPLLGNSIQALQWIANSVAGLPGAKIAVPEVSGWFLGLFVLGGLWFCLWTGRARWAGALPMLASVFYLFQPLPWAVISSDGKLMAFIEEGTLWVNTGRAKRFQQKVWMESYGLLYKKPWKHGRRWKLPIDVNIVPEENEIIFSTNAACKFESLERFSVQRCIFGKEQITAQQLNAHGSLSVFKKSNGYQLQWLFPNSYNRHWWKRGVSDS